ncbi:uncharacterized protein LOC105433864 [Pogonomyrmex barbatus]|uniref:Uncharacterized protein LOC105433864 n=1 Tax=Pogonomyrmex barbatus TaxID=144034 RepID=A0A6I9WW58_9HYME|nr:uncharacterized protein LOC105433864 [Pogonomyrmex barbatus]
MFTLRTQANFHTIQLSMRGTNRNKAGEQSWSLQIVGHTLWRGHRERRRNPVGESFFYRELTGHADAGTAVSFSHRFDSVRRDVSARRRCFQSGNGKVWMVIATMSRTT